MNTKEFLIVHHTGGTNFNPLLDTSHHTFEMVKAWHIAKGWDTIGYHYFIEKNGKIWHGRPDNSEGAHALGYNLKSIGICLAGNFDLTLPTQEQINSLKTLLSTLREKYNIPLEKIVPHRAFSNKTCYGSKLPDNWARSMAGQNFSKELVLTMLNDFRDEVEALE